MALSNCSGSVVRAPASQPNGPAPVLSNGHCLTVGSPVIDTATGKVVAVNDTGNENGGRCTDNNPCEVDESGRVTVRRRINYAQETYTAAPCTGPGSVTDLNRPGRTLP